MSTVGAQHEQCLALKEIWNIVLLYGMPITLYLRGEPEVTRDDYSSIKKKSIGTSYTYNFKAHPVQYNPTDQQIEKAGIREHIEVIAYIPTKYFIDNSLEFSDIDLIRATVELQGVTYKIRNKNRVDKFFDQYLYVTLGLFQV